MSAYSKIDRDTFKWVKTEVEVSLDRARSELQVFVKDDDNKALYGVSNHLHQIVGSLQMMEFKSLSSLTLESELLIENFTDSEQEIDKSSFIVLLESAFSALQNSITQIDQGSAENPILIVELINQIRAIRGQDEVEISSLFSPMIEVFPEIKGKQALKDEDYQKRSAALRVRYQVFLLHWLRDKDAAAVDRLRLVAEKLLSMSAFGAVARLWWVVTAYVDYLKHNELSNRAVHGRILRGVDDLLRNLTQQGESALVRDPGEELIKIMLFYTGVAENRSDRMNEIAKAFSLHEYFPTLESLNDGEDFEKIEIQLSELNKSSDLPLPLIRQLVTSYFEDEQIDNNSLLEILAQMEIVSEAYESANIEVLIPIISEALKVVKGMRNGSIESSEDVGFQLAAAIMFLESSQNGSEQVDQRWLENSRLKYTALHAINNHQELLPEMDGTHLSGSERKALLDVVGAEVEENLKDIEVNLDAYSSDTSNTDLLTGISLKIRQIRGALQVLGEQKMGLLLQMSEDQFTALQNGDVEPTPALIEALAISIGTMEEYVRGLQSGREGMNYLLDRTITDLEVAIGKKVTRADVESLLDDSSGALFSWLAEQGDFDLFTKLKSNLRDVLTLAKKTGLRDVEELVKEQDRLVDVISQEPAFLTDNITASLQNNMANITEQLIQLYGTEETPEELEADASPDDRISTIEVEDDGVKYHDNMDVDKLSEELSENIDLADGASQNSTEIGKQHAVNNQQAPMVDDSIFDVFVEESTVVLQEADSYFIACQTDHNNGESIRELRRAFHTLKGSARMVGLNEIGEVAWFSESLFNYVLDTEKPLTDSILEFAGKALETFKTHLSERYQNQHLIDTAEWGTATENVVMEDDTAHSKLEAKIDSVSLENDLSDSPIIELDSTEDGQDLAIDEERISDIETTSVLEFSSDFDSSIDLNIQDDINEDIETINLEDDLEGITFDSGNEEAIDIESVSFSVIDDQQMRDVFVQEVKLNLGIIADQLDIDSLVISEDDALSISIHTLLGNARTLGLNELSDAFSKAQDLSLLKRESTTALNSLEKGALRKLSAATLDLVMGVKEVEPYFELDSEQWQLLNQELQSILDNDQRVVDSDVLDEDIVLDLGGLSDNSDDQPVNDDFEFDDIENIVIESSDVELLIDGNDNSEEDAAARVAAVLDDIELIEDPIAEDEITNSATGSSSNQENDELNDLELSLSSMRNEQSDVVENLNDIISIENEAIDKEVVDSENLSDDSNEAAAELQESLIPDELTNLIEDDIQTLESAIQTNDEIEISEADSSIIAPEILDDEIESRNDKEDELQLRNEQLIVEMPSNENGLINSGTKNDGNYDVDAELREVFLDELKSLHAELDEEVAQLVSLKKTPAAMANIMRYLHTIKGSSLMAEAASLGELTHQTESYLEESFIRDEDGLKVVRNTLEMYVDAVDVARELFQRGESFTATPDLLERIGVEVDSSAVSLVKQLVEDINEEALSETEIKETLTAVTENMSEINTAWKSTRGWIKNRTKMLAQVQVLDDLIVQVDELEPVSELLSEIKNYIEVLALKSSAEFKTSKSLLEEVFDAVISNANLLIQGEPIENFDHLYDQLQGEAKTKRKKKTTKKETKQVKTKAVNEGKPTSVDSDIFVPGSKEMDEAQQQDLDRQEKAARERAAALRIRTETLDSLTNYVGDASMNRSQMREDVVSIKGVVDGLYENVLRFGKQLRELEIETDSKITSRTGESLSKDRGEEFDPLEMDSYTKLQQLSRGLTENLDELGTIQSSLSNFVYKTETSLQKQDRLNRELQDEIMQVRLVSFGGIAPQLRQIVRRTSRELKKDVELELIGSDVRMDKTILDGVVPALEHMLRNAVDHGIEKASVRTKKKKSKTGKIIVECKQIAREIVISVQDDGAGLNIEKIRKKAIEDNFLAKDQPLVPEDMMMYISQSGFSTASKLTQISGRGVGMDVVQTTLRRMSGSISYDIENDKPGSRFTIKLPISLAVSSAMFVEAGGEQFAISARTIERVINTSGDQLLTYLKADKPSIELAGQSYVLIELADYLGYESKLSNTKAKVPVILVNAGVQNIAVIIDKLLDTQEIVVKSLGEHLGRIPIYAGATIRGDGKIIMLVDLVGISYYESFITPPDSVSNITESTPNILIVDDSLTVRKSAERDITAIGFNAIMAKDGLDAQDQLHQIVPDMILLDIEMPRMDGFELLEWVKQEKNLKHIPVVMISSRATEKHIKKATKLGCASFLGKPYLLENLVAAFNQHLSLATPIKLD